MSDNSLKLPQFTKGQAPTLLKTEHANKVRDFIGSLLDCVVNIRVAETFEGIGGSLDISKNNAVLNLRVPNVTTGGSSGEGFEEIENVYYVINGTLYTGTFLIKDSTAV